MSSEESFLSHPELERYFQKLLPELVNESDRGAILLGVSQIDEHLKTLFEHLLPDGISNNRRKEIFNLTGPFGSFSSKLEIALVCRLLPPNLVSAVHKVRKMRNDLAHKTSSFSLTDHQEQLYEIFSLLGPGVDIGINRLTLDILMERTLSKLLELDHTINEGVPLFDGKREAVQYLSENGEVLKILEEQRPRWEFSIGVGMICGVILLHRERISSALNGTNTLLSLVSNSVQDEPKQ
ncbi:hypothetical protein OLL83_000385 [Shewanella algae]|uniref:hypothetical protein n=1 Tax=Shewanella algae TaxID=38313 RepID=UPI00222F3503|nr:hypothetical protein [Shewanella algae]UZD58903.1 hypothetical protein OLL83_000385 [Shewanella algae]